ncbi:hypothetical protein [Flavobacterium humi]|uniref:Chromosome partitioning protein ParA n=1 Tax=Flavobacterium humi TaxID=2562683 RepID=A0A4Z0L7G3_9FLAO|nr:hypothetical protein [Flavobacterium humi]TGD58463.1 hypothetical protein E4635_06000 [Flavobacterium humi]
MTLRTSLKMIKLSAVVFASVGIVFASKYYQGKSQNKKLQQEIQLEKITHSNELTEILSRYDATLNENKELLRQQNAPQQTVPANIKPVATVVAPTPKTQEIRQEIHPNAKKIDSLKNQLKEQSDQNKSLATELGELSSKYRELKKRNDSNESALALSKNLTAINVYANGIKIVSNNIIETKRFSAIEQIKVCFTLLENKAAIKGNKDIYIQIVNPDNKVVSKNGDFVEEDSRLLSYSAKTNIYYDNEELDVCVFVDPNKNDIQKGDYEINIFSGINLIGSTVFSLK